MNQSIDKAKETYAIVVGIEQYQIAKSLDGAASNALSFTDWLLKCGVPESNIYLFISELESHDSQTGNEQLISNYKEQKNLKILKASKENISKTLFEEIPQKKGKLLYFYWLGHGYISNVTQRQLLYSDTTNNTSPFNLSSFLESLKTDTFSNFDEQILFVDACAVYAYQQSKKIYVGETLAKEEYKIGKPKSRQQFSFLASQEGDTAKFDEKENTAIFSKILLEIITKKTELWIPEEMKTLAKEIQSVFQEDYPDYSEPIYLWCDAIGNVENFYLKANLKNSSVSNVNITANNSKNSKIESYQKEIERLKSQIDHLEELQNLCKRDFMAEQNGARRHQLNIQIENYSNEIDQLYDKIDSIYEKINNIKNS